MPEPSPWATLRPSPGTLSVGAVSAGRYAAVHGSAAGPPWTLELAWTQSLCPRDLGHSLGKSGRAKEGTGVNVGHWLFGPQFKVALHSLTITHCPEWQLKSWQVLPRAHGKSELALAWIPGRCIPESHFSAFSRQFAASGAGTVTRRHGAAGSSTCARAA